MKKNSYVRIALESFWIEMEPTRELVIGIVILRSGRPVRYDGWRTDGTLYCSSCYGTIRDRDFMSMGAHDKKENEKRKTPIEGEAAKRRRRLH